MKTLNSAFTSFCRRCLKGMAVAALTMCTLAADAEVYEHQFFNANFPDLSPDKLTVKRKDLMDKISYADNTMQLTVLVYPISLNPSLVSLVAKEMECKAPDKNAAQTVLLGDVPVKKYEISDVREGLYPLYTNLYVLSNGENTIAFAETRFDRHGNWWADNMKLKVKATPVKSLAERTQAFQEFYNGIDGKDKTPFRIAADDKQLNISLNESLLRSSKDTESGVKRFIYRLFLFSSIFEEYSDMGFPISVSLVDADGNEHFFKTYTQPEYSSWKDL